MLIECIAKTDGVVETPIGNDVYVFRLDAFGRKVCDVDRREHIDAFLSVEGIYRLAVELLAVEIEPVVVPDPPAADVTSTEPAPAVQPASPGATADMGRDELAALYDQKFGRRPHAKMSVENLIERINA